MDVILVKNLSKSFSNRMILDNINFSIREKTFCAVIGPNGSGKTTLLKMMAGLIASKDVYIYNKPIGYFKQKELAKIVSFLPQFLLRANVNLIEFLKMSEYPYEFIGGKALIKGDIMSILDIVGIKHLKNTSLNDLSGGELELVYIASCLAQKPKILFADEPTTFLDFFYKKRIKSILSNLSKHITVVIATHDLDWVASKADQIIGLKDSKLIFSKSNKNINEDIMHNLFSKNVGHSNEFEKILM